MKYIFVKKTLLSVGLISWLYTGSPSPTPIMSYTPYQTPTAKIVELYIPAQLPTPSAECISVPVHGALSTVGTRYCVCCSKYRWHVWGRQAPTKEEYYTTCICPE
jgi:hypothetical protein